METEQIISLIKNYLKEKRQYEQALQISRKLTEKFRQHKNCRETILPPIPAHRCHQQQLERMLGEADNDCKRRLGQWYYLDDEAQKDDELTLLLERYGVIIPPLSFWEKWALTINSWFKRC